ncbi:MAG: DUF1580 domain-containing protein [Pirellulales bacterium]
MAIDISKETPITLSVAARRLPRRRRGKRPHVSTLHRWGTTGLRGVRLETIRVGGSRCTSMQALQRFFDALDDAPQQPTTQSPTRIQRDASSAGEKLEKEGF